MIYKLEPGKNDHMRENRIISRYINTFDEYKKYRTEPSKVRNVNFEGRNYQVSKNSILTINTTSLCNAKCKFCYNEITFSPESNYVNYETEDFNKLIEFCNAAQIETLAISGGEPTLQPLKLLGLMNRVHSEFKRVRMHSNGFKLLDIVDYNGKQKFLCEHLRDFNLMDISLSIAHYDRKINKEIMGLSDVFETLKESDIKKIAGIISLRLSCFLTKEGISTPNDALSYVEWGRKLGVKKFIFRSAANIPSDESKDTNQTEYNSENRMMIGSYVKLFTENGFNIDYSHLKSDSHIYILKKDDLIVDFSASGEEIDPDDRIRRLILMQDNKLYTSWINCSSELKINEKRM